MGTQKIFARAIRCRNFDTYNVTVNPKFRRRAFGKSLVEFILADSKSHGIKILQLLAPREGRDLYKKHDFTECASDSPGMIKIL